MTVAAWVLQALETGDLGNPKATLRKAGGHSSRCAVRCPNRGHPAKVGQQMLAN